MAKLDIDIWDTRSFDKAIRKLEREKELLNHRTASFVQTLGTMGREVADREYKEAAIAGPNDIDVNMWESSTENGYKATIVASGTAVLFTEFGTGIFKSDSYEARDELEDQTGLVLHGFYGRGWGAKPNGWNFIWEPPEGANLPSGTYFMKERSKGRGMPVTHTRGQDAVPAMYHAKKHMERWMKTVLRRTFR